MKNNELLAPNLVKFLITSAACLFVGTVQGAVQVMEPIRSWLVSIGTPNTNPGHLIDPLAHAHINLIGGVVLFLIGMVYYHFPRMSGKPLYSNRLVEHTYWWVTIGIVSFYLSLMTFGIVEGMLMLEGSPMQEVVHSYYSPVIATCATIMTVGYGAFFFNLTLSVMKKPELEGKAAAERG
ncbi:MAG: cbb3-type cytochrome c oxidase subunit I [Gammaproteobacteria bacterium]|nr:cbb3-type cytochrome c oxidase subunit I [Gammaproteobacteria bacterium]